MTPSGLCAQDIQLAATYVQDAQHGRYGRFRTEQKYVRLYHLYHHPALEWTANIAIGLLLALALFEEPHAVPGLQLKYWITMPVELVCLGVIFGRMAHGRLFSSEEHYWRNRGRMSILIVLLLVLLDIILYVILRTAGLQAYRWSRPLRTAFLINMDRARHLRGALKNILLTLPDIITVLILLLLCIIFFAFAALKIFQKRENMNFYDVSEPYLSNFMDNCFHLYVLVTTANFPDIMMPAFDSSPWFALFFIIYLVICLYLLMGICLATIYNNFKEHLKEEVSNLMKLKKENLVKAFDLLAVQGEYERIVTRQCWMSAMQLVNPRHSDLQRALLWDVLDKANRGFIGLREFLQVIDLLDMEVMEVKDRQPLFGRLFPTWYNCRASVLIRKVIVHRFFRYFVDTAVIANVVCIALDVDDVEVEAFFLTLFTLEILLKFYAIGFKPFFCRVINVFDFVVIGAALILNIVEAITGPNELQVTDLLLVLRILRLVRLIGDIPRFRVVLRTISNVSRSVISYAGVLFIVYYFFAILGMECFGGKIHSTMNVANGTDSRTNCGNPKLNNSSFAHNHYCGNNFNDLLRSFILLFELMIVNQWHVLTSGYVAVTHQAARIYFFIYHLVVVILVMNIMSAFILEAFLLEYSMSNQPPERRETVMERRITQLGLEEPGSLPDEEGRLDTVEEMEEVESSMIQPLDSQAPCVDSQQDAAGRVRRMGVAYPGMRFRFSRGGDKVAGLLQRMLQIEEEDQGQGCYD